MKPEDLTQTSPGMLIYPPIKRGNVYKLTQNIYDVPGLELQKGEVIVIQDIMTYGYSIYSYNSKLRYSVGKIMFAEFILRGIVEKRSHAKEAL